MMGTIAASCVSNFCKAKAKERGAADPLRPYKAQEGANYGIPDFSCRRSNDGTLRADHNRLFETARMVTANLSPRSVGALFSDNGNSALTARIITRPQRQVIFVCALPRASGSASDIDGLCAGEATIRKGKFPLGATLRPSQQ